MKDGTATTTPKLIDAADAGQTAFLDFDVSAVCRECELFADGSEGNGGFSLRSRRLLQAMRSEGFLRVEAPEDDVIARHNRPWLERAHGIRFAPADIADRFAYERGDPQRPTFGFHGLFNLWRHLDDTQVLSSDWASYPILGFSEAPPIEVVRARVEAA